MSKPTTEDLKSVIAEVMKDEGQKKYKINISGSGVIGGGYAGEVTFVNVKTSKCTNYDLVIKSAQKSDKLREKTPIRKLYLREIYMYSKILPVFERFEVKNLIQEPFKKYPKCYKCCEKEKEEFVVLENLKVQGYEVHNRKVTLSLEHIQFVLVQFGHFHAISLAMKRLKPELFGIITKDVDDIFEFYVILANMVPGFTEYFRGALKLLNTTEAKKFEGFESDLEHWLTKAAYDPDDPLTVIVHGDSWNNNFMFKYDESNKNKPIDMRFLDFQFSRVAHPIVDLSVLFYTCCDEETLKNFDSLLELYYSTLSDSLSQFGLDVNTFFSLSKLREDWKMFGKFGLYDSVIVLYFATCENEEVLDLEEIAESGKEFKDKFISMKKDELYNKRVKAALEHFAKNFL